MHTHINKLLLLMWHILIMVLVLLHVHHHLNSSCQIMLNFWRIFHGTLHINIPCLAVFACWIADLFNMCVAQLIGLNNSFFFHAFRDLFHIRVKV